MNDPQQAVQNAARIYAELEARLGKAEEVARMAQQQTSDQTVRIEMLERQNTKLQDERDFYMKGSTELATGIRGAIGLLQDIVSGAIAEANRPTLRQPTTHDNGDALKELEAVISKNVSDNYQGRMPPSISEADRA